ncbi:MAG: hypothetical protein KAX19_12595, partial [Candidatus Brocadiae bacterium]|nr:hypothetical protein [Candidatus Brocadiia bacterium]
MRKCCRLLGLVLCFCAAIGSAGAVTIWREGEDATVHTMNRHPWWYDQVKIEHLSGGEWMSNFSEDKEGTATYDFAVPEEGDYGFWLRANPVQSALSYRLDGGDWTPVDFEGAVQTENIAADGAPDLRFIGWVWAGTLHLTAGEHTLRFRMHSESQHHGGLDAFVLTTDGFRPDGLTKPGGATAGLAGRPQPEILEADSWAFSPPADPFTDDALLDLRYLNEDIAGETGLVRVSEDGMSFVKGDGTPIRFWSVCGFGQDWTDEQRAEHARFLAKIGVNMVRIFGTITP